MYSDVACGYSVRGCLIGTRHLVGELRRNTAPLRRNTSSALGRPRSPAARGIFLGASLVFLLASPYSLSKDDASAKPTELAGHLRNESASAVFIMKYDDEINYFDYFELEN